MPLNFAKAPFSNFGHTLRLSIFGLLALIGLVITILPEQRVSAVESTEWMATADEVASVDQPVRLIHSWQKTTYKCFSSFTHFYQIIFESEDSLSAPFAAHFKSQYHFPRRLHFSPRLFYPASTEEFPNFLLS